MVLIEVDIKTNLVGASRFSYHAGPCPICLSTKTLFSDGSRFIEAMERCGLCNRDGEVTWRTKSLEVKHENS